MTVRKDDAPAAAHGIDPQRHQADALGYEVFINHALRLLGWHLWQLAWRKCMAAPTSPIVYVKICY